MALAEAKTEQKRDRKAVDGVIAALAAQLIPRARADEPLTTIAP